MPSKRSHIRPTAPTRLAEKKPYTGDRFKTLIFHVAALDVFLTINRNAKPARFVDFVALKPPINGEIDLEIYDNQENIFGVVEWLDFIKLAESEQQHPRTLPPFANFCILILLWLADALV